MSLTTADPATILVRGGQVVDGTGAPRPADVVVAGTRISAVIDRDGADGPSVAPPEPGGTASVVDARGCLVLPGLIDLHTHVFAPGTGLGGAPDTVGVDQAVTTVVDAGSTGARDFARFREDVVAPARTRVLSWLNIAEPGLVDGLSELADLSAVATPATAQLLASQIAEDAGDRIVRGIKVRMSSSVTRGTGTAGLARALELADAHGLPVMVHVGNEPPTLVEVAAMLRPGDVITHAFHGKAGGLFDDAGYLHRGVVRARERGVLFDVGHGSASLSFETVEHAIAEDFAPQLASTDLHAGNLDGPVHHLAMTMTKMLAVGLPLSEIVRATTSAAADVISETGRLGSLAPGATADVSLLRIVERRVTLVDAEGATRDTDHVLEPVGAVVAGRPVTEAVVSR